MNLYEILVPTVHQDGRPIHTRFHRVWDNFVKNLSNGLTILRPAKGIWVNPVNKETVEERMIPVRVACSEEIINKIIDYTIKYYNQDAVMAYQISNNVIIKNK